MKIFEYRDMNSALLVIYWSFYIFKMAERGKQAPPKEEAPAKVGGKAGFNAKRYERPGFTED